MSYKNQVVPDDVNVHEFKTTYLSEPFNETWNETYNDFNQENEAVNNYEVNLILESYLVLWSRDRSRNCILLADLLSEFDKIYYNLITQIFKEEAVFYDDYFESFAILLFCNFNQITSYLLTMMNINSNIMINEEQIDRVLDVFDRQYINIFDFKENSHNKIYLNDSDAYSIKTFVPWLISCLGFQSLIFGVRNAIVELTLGTSSFNNITKRIKHYYSAIKANIMNSDTNTSFMCNKLIAMQLPPLSPQSLSSNPSTATNSFCFTSNNNSPDKILNYSNSNNNNLKLKPSKPPVMPKESCLSKVKRIVFSNEPPKYYYDYYLMYPSVNSINDLILELRSGKGYGMRNRSSTNISKRNCFRSKVKTTCVCSSNKKNNTNTDNKGNVFNNKNLKKSRVKSCNFSAPPSSIRLNLNDNTPNTIQVMPRRFDMTKSKNKSDLKLNHSKNFDKNIIESKNIIEPKNKVGKLQMQYSF